MEKLPWLDDASKGGRMILEQLARHARMRTKTSFSVLIDRWLRGTFTLVGRGIAE